MDTATSDNKSLIKAFYNAFQKKDFKTMQNSYHDEAVFSDPVFKELNAAEVKAMWQMLCERGKDFVLNFSDIQEIGDRVTCNWEAQYTFGVTGRKVHNKIFATFSFKEGKILSHKDEFNFWKWSRMALGAPGFFLGWTPFLRQKVCANALKSLKQYRSS